MQMQCNNNSQNTNRYNAISVKSDCLAQSNSQLLLLRVTLLRGSVPCLLYFALLCDALLGFALLHCFALLFCFTVLLNCSVLLFWDPLMVTAPHIWWGFRAPQEGATSQQTAISAISTRTSWPAVTGTWLRLESAVPSLCILIFA